MSYITLRKRLLQRRRPGESSRFSAPARATAFRIRGATFGAAVLALCLSLTGCAPDRVPAAGVAACPAGQAQSAETMVVTATGTSAEPQVAIPAALVNDLERAGRSDTGCLLLVRPDGSLAALSLTPRRGGRIEVGSQREALRQRTLAAIGEALADVVAQSDGLDPRTVITNAVRAHPTPGTLVVITSGLSTVEPIDLRRLTWSVHGPTLGAFLRREGWLDLRGWDVRFAGLGDVAGTQPPLPAPVQRQLSRVWLGICKGAGAAHCADLGHLVDTRPPRSTNSVPPVQTPPVESFEDRVLWVSQTTFHLDSATLSSLADLQLRVVVRRVLDGDLIITITGHTDASTGDEAHNRDLSLRRAEAVRTRLLQLGLPGNRIVAVDGVGSQGYSADDEAREPALRNRRRGVDISFSHRPAAP